MSTSAENAKVVKIIETDPRWASVTARTTGGFPVLCHHEGMAIDEPLAALDAQIENEERPRTDVEKYVREITGLLPGWFGKALSWSVQRDRSAKQRLVIETIKSEVRRHEARIAELLARAPASREFVQAEWIPLVVDGIKKAEQTRNEDRARTIGLILSNAILCEPLPPADYVEEMLRVATILDNTDAEVLRQIVEKQGRLLPATGALDENGANEAWHESPPKIAGLSDAMITSICAKLESLGLVRAVRPRDTWYSLKTVGTPFTLLEKGRDFTAFVTRRSSG